MPLFAPELELLLLLLPEFAPEPFDVSELDPVAPELLESELFVELLPDPAPPEVLLFVFVAELPEDGAFWLPEP